MTFKNDLISKGYLPDHLPPSFETENIATYVEQQDFRGYLTQGQNPVRSASYNASKRGMTRRAFSIVHPVTAHDLAEFSSSRWDAIETFFEQSTFSLSVPHQTPEGQRALEISSHRELESQRLASLSQYRFIAKTDISRFYHAIYTHSIPWAFHGKAESKADRNVRSANIFCNRIDQIVRCGQDGQTVGIPVGPDASRILAEIIGTAIDIEFVRRRQGLNCHILRHVDDVWIGANNYDDAETALSRYRESIREFELDINENKTGIYSRDFKFYDRWPTEISSQFEFALHSPPNRIPERLRAACEHAFSMAARESDDGILKYTIRYLDDMDVQWRHWETVEPFLKRAAVHFGHTVDYVSRVVVWRSLAFDDLDNDSWSEIFLTILDNHARLGNDSEVCWAIYSCIRLEIEIPHEISETIVENCGALSIVALLNCIELDLVERNLFPFTIDRLSLEDANGPYWPVILEWLARDWPNHNQLSVEQDQIREMAANSVTLFSTDRLPIVFQDIEEDNFRNVRAAIEQRVGAYDDDDNDGDAFELDENPF